MSIETLRMHSIMNEHDIKKIKPELSILFYEFVVCIRIFAVYKCKTFYEERRISFPKWKAFDEKCFKFELEQMYGGFLLAFKNFGDKNRSSRMTPGDNVVPAKGVFAAMTGKIISMQEGIDPEEYLCHITVEFENGKRGLYAQKELFIKK